MTQIPEAGQGEAEWNAAIRAAAEEARKCMADATAENILALLRPATLAAVNLNVDKNTTVVNPCVNGKISCAEREAIYKDQIVTGGRVIDELRAEVATLKEQNSGYLYMIEADERIITTLTADLKWMRELVVGYSDAVATMNAAMKDATNVHGALSAIVGYEDQINDIRAADCRTLAERITAAIEAERERCAKLADKHRERWSCAGGFGGHSAAARIIAAAIRAGEP